MISAAQWGAYNAAVESIRSKASSAVQREVLGWCAAHEGATVEDAREAAKAIVARYAMTCDQDAAALAAEWYDAQARSAGAKLDRAVTAVTYTSHDVDKLVRYQVEKYKNGDVGGFAAMCGEYTANDAMRSVNRTILKNARRDKAKGVMFARVTSGLNTCAFCLMLAGRGAVYHTRKSAGEFDHWHRHCTCKVVPSFSGDKYEVLVEGRDPRKIESRLKEVERLTGVKPNTPEFTREVALRDPNWLLGGDAATDYSLNPIENYGRLMVPGDYSAENVIGRENEWRDLWAHHVLVENGISAHVHGAADLDITINGEWWEIKSPDAGDENLRFIESSVRKASKQFRKRQITPRRIVFNPRYRDCDRAKLKDELTRQMRVHGISEAMLINDDGTITRLTA